MPKQWLSSKEKCLEKKLHSERAEEVSCFEGSRAPERRSVNAEPLCASNSTGKRFRIWADRWMRSTKEMWLDEKQREVVQIGIKNGSALTEKADTLLTVKRRAARN